MWATLLIDLNLPKVNNHPKGENSPNLVTLPTTIFFVEGLGPVLFFCEV
jgi:hypothetical protein